MGKKKHRIYYNNDYSDIVRLLMYVVIFVIITITIVKVLKELNLVKKDDDIR